MIGQSFIGGPSQSLEPSSLWYDPNSSSSALVNTRWLDSAASNYILNRG